MPTEPIFSYAAAPQPVKPRSKYRNVGEEAGITLMSDPRVRRGTTLGTSKGANPLRNGAAVSQTKANRIPRDSEPAESLNVHSQPTYTFEVGSFAGSEFNMNQYLIAADESVTKNSNQNESCQTDEFVPLPPPADYIPRKTGIDVYTQVEDQRDLFEFDSEVKPMVNVIVKKTIEQALFELNSEDELITLQAEVDKFNLERETEARWIFLREKETIEDNKAKEQDLHGRIRRIEIAKGVRRSVAASAAMRQLLPSILNDVLKDLFLKGAWKDEDREVAKTMVIPRLTDFVKQKIDLYDAASVMVEELLLRAQEKHAELGEVEHIKRKNVYVHVVLSAKETGGDKDISLGCFRLNPQSTLASLEHEIQSKVTEKKITIFSSLQKPLSNTFGKYTDSLQANLELLSLDVPQQIDIRI